ncbi:MAG: hypothetical protein KGJ60_04900 [Verrucomicrobiota bacterium]|nr:hypothetical protein [Verrucomicrobiota bacterium]
MTVDTDASVTDIHPATRGNELRDHREGARIGKNSMLAGRCQRRIHQVIEHAVEVAAETQWMVLRQPGILLVQIFVHANEEHIPAGNLLLVEPSRQQRILVHGTDRDDESGLASFLIGGNDLGLQIFSQIQAERRRVATTPRTRRSLQEVAEAFSRERQTIESDSAAKA